MTIEEMNESKTEVEQKITKLLNEFSALTSLNIKKVKLEKISTMNSDVYIARLKTEL